MIVVVVEVVLTDEDMNSGDVSSLDSNKCRNLLLMRVIIGSEVNVTLAQVSPHKVKKKKRKRISSAGFSNNL